MPVYRYKGDIYDIPDEKVSAFEKQFPDATVSFQSDGDVFDIPVSKKAQFLKQYPKAQLYSEQQESVTQPSRTGAKTERDQQAAAAEGRSMFNQMTAARRGTSSLADAPQATQDYLNRPLSKEDKEKYTGKAGPSMDEMYLGAEQIKQEAQNAAEKFQEAVENPKLARFNELIDKAQSTQLMSADEYKEMNDLYSAPEVNPMAQLKAAIARRNFNNSPEGEFARLSQQLTKLDKHSKEYEAVEKAWTETEFYKTKSDGLKNAVAGLAEKTRESLGMDPSLYTTWFKMMMRNPATNPSGVIPDTHVKDTQAATSRMLAEAAKILNDPSKYDDTTWLQRRGRFAKEYGKEMVNPEMWLKSLFQAEDALPLRNVFGKIAEHYGNVDERLLKDDDIDNILDEDEKNLLRAYFMLSEAQTLRPEVADYIQSARSAANSTKFIIEMAISGEALGFNALEKKLYDEGAKKLAATYLAKWAEKQIVWDGTFALAAKAGQAVTKLAGKSLLTYATSYPAVLFHPTTWGDFAERMSRPNEDGKYDPDALKEAWGAIRNQQKERWTETLGETVFNEFLGSAVRGLGLAGRKALGNGLAGKMADEAAYRFSEIGDYISSTKPAQFIKKAANSSWGQKVRQIAEATHFDGIGPEIGEEALGAAIDAFRQKSAEPLRDFFTWDNLIMTGESFLPMYIWGGGFSAAGLAASRIKYGHSSKRLENLMKKYGYSDEQVQYIFDQTKGAAPAEISRLLADLGVNITNSRFGAAAAVVMDDEQEEIVNAFKDYLRDSVEYNTYDAMREEEEAGQREILKQQLEENYGHKFYIDATEDEPQRVIRARVNDGKGGLADVFLLDDKPGINGKYYAMYPDGQMGWVGVEDMAPMTDDAGNPVLDQLGKFIPSYQVQTLDAFLSEQVMAQRQTETAVDNTNRLLAANATLMESVKQIEDNLKHNGKDGYLVRSDESGAEFRPFDDDGKPGEFVPWAQLAIENGITTADAPIPTAEDEVEAEGESMAQAVISRRNIAEIVNLEGENSYTIEQDGKTYRLIYALPGSVDAVEGRITGVFAGPNGERRAFSFAYDDVLNPRFEGEDDGVEPPAAPQTEPEPAPAAEETPAEEAPKSKIPVDKDGNKIYDAPGVEPIDAYDDMYSTPGLSEEDVDEWVIAQSDEAEKNRNPKIKKGQSLQDWGKEKAEANRKADFWKQFRDIAEERAKEREEARKQEAERQKEIEKYGVDTRGFDLTPQTVEEAVANYLGNNEGIIDLDDAKKEVFGKSGRIPSELFRHVGNGGILTKKGGRTIADVANDIVGEYEGTMAIEQAQVRDLIIDYLARYTKSEMRDMIFNNRLNAALTELEQQNGTSSVAETAEEVVDDLPPAEEEYGPVIRTYETKKGIVEVRTKVSEKDGVRTTKVVSIRNGEEVVAGDTMPMPEGYRITDATNVEGGLDVVGIRELREAEDGRVAATVLARLEDGTLAELHVALERADSIPAEEAVEEAPEGTAVPEVEEPVAEPAEPEPATAEEETPENNAPESSETPENSVPSQEEETPAEPEGPRMLTEEEIRNSGFADEDVIDAAIDYINGNHGFAETLAYNQIEEYVRTQRSTTEQTGSNADQTQLDGPVVRTGGVAAEQSGSQPGELGGNQETGTSERIPGSENGGVSAGVRGAANAQGAGLSSDAGDTGSERRGGSNRAGQSGRSSDDRGAGSQSAPVAGQPGEQGTATQAESTGLGDAGRERNVDQGRSGAGVRGGQNEQGAQGLADAQPARAEIEAGSTDIEALGGELEDLLKQFSNTTPSIDRDINGLDSVSYSVDTSGDEEGRLSRKQPKRPTAPLSLEGMTPQQMQLAGKILFSAAKLGYAFAKTEGLTTYNDFHRWFTGKFGDAVMKGLNYNETSLDAFIREVWNTKMKIDGERLTLEQHSQELHNAELREQSKKSPAERTRLQKEANEKKIPFKAANRKNIAEALPQLIPGQWDDVVAIERQFFDPSHNDYDHAYGKGMLITNGTGTGKTFTGLGVIKRFLDQGKGRILLVAPASMTGEWVDKAKIMGITATKLANTKDKGKGVVVTSYENFRENRALYEDDFDLVVYDECQNIIENQKGEDTLAFEAHKRITNKNVEEAIERLVANTQPGRRKYELEQENDRLETERKKRSTRESRLNEIVIRQREIEQEIQDLDRQIALLKPSFQQKAEEAVKKTKVLMLSATPFNTVQNLKFAEGYIFQYPKVFKSDGTEVKDEASRQSAFMTEWFRGDEPMEDMEIAFGDHLLDELETASYRELENGFDHSRDFPDVSGNVMASRFNAAWQAIQKDPRFQELREYTKFLTDPTWTTQLFETMKVSAIRERLKEHLDAGRKIVIFHDRVHETQTTERRPAVGPPFATVLEQALLGSKNGKTPVTAIAEFRQRFADVLAWEQTLDYRPVHEQIVDLYATDADRAAFNKDMEEYNRKMEQWEQDVREFERRNPQMTPEELYEKMPKAPKRPQLKAESVAVYNGEKTDAEKDAAKAAFNDDNSKVKIICVTTRSGGAGLSLHDTTGKYPRVMIQTALPVSPIGFIQAEGRIFRWGNQSNAVFEYPRLGIDLEAYVFAMQFNAKAETVENLAHGFRGRGLKDSIMTGFWENSGNVPVDGQGIGGVEMDKRGNTLKGMAKAKHDYGVVQRKGVKEGDTSIPEPVGYKMAEWAKAMSGDAALIPFAGRGSIARYIPKGVTTSALEDNVSLQSDLMVTSGGADFKIREGNFTELNMINKADVVLLNGATDQGGLDQIDTFKKGFGHLSEGGRLIAIVPDNAAANNAISEITGNLGGALRATIKVKNEALDRGEGTSRIVILDKISNPQLRATAGQPVTVDLTNSTKEQVFDLLENVNIPDRIIDKEAIAIKKLNALGTEFRKNRLVEDYKIEESGRYKYIRFQWRRKPNGFTYAKRGIQVVRRDSYYDKGSGVYINLRDFENPNQYHQYIKAYQLIGEVLQMDDAEFRRFAQLDDNAKTEDVDALRELYRLYQKMIRAAFGLSESQIRRVVQGMRPDVSASDIETLNSYEELRAKFEAANHDDQERQDLYDKIAPVGEQLGLTIGAEAMDRDFLGGYNNVDNSLKVNKLRWNTISDDKRATTLLHEFIHSVTVYALAAYNTNAPGVSDALFTAAKLASDVFDQVQRGAAQDVRPFTGFYAIENEKEILAEMANPDFREKLKNRRMWVQRSPRGIRVSGSEMEGAELTNAWALLNEALDGMLKNFDKSLFDRFRGRVNDFFWEVDREGNPTREADGGRSDEEQNGNTDTELRFRDGEENPQIYTPEFKAWFGDWENDPENASKVVNENGTPRVVYHGTKMPFWTFDGGKSRGMFTDGLNYFALDRQFAEDWARKDDEKRRTPEDNQRLEAAKEKRREYAREIVRKIKEKYGDKVDYTETQEWKEYEAVRKQWERDNLDLDGMTLNEAMYELGKRVLPVYINARNPYNPTERYESEGRQMLIDLGLLEPNPAPMSEMYARGGAYLYYENKKVVDELKKRGYDAIYLSENVWSDESKNLRTLAVWDANRIKSATDNNGEFDTANDDIRFREDPTAARVRQKEDPKKTIKVYKLMRLGDDGKLYPLFIDSSAGISIGEWYDAESPDLDFLKKIPSGVFLVNPADGSYTSLDDYANEHGFKAGKFPPKDAINEASVNGMRWVKITDTEKGQRRYEGENRKYENIGINGSGSVSTFAMRPGWHAGSLPTMRQIGKGPQKNLRDDSFVWVEGEVPADVDYNAEAQSNPDNDIPTHIPTDGFYMKSTNANAKAAQADKVGWYVAGSFKANRIISDAEARAVIDEYNMSHREQEPVEYDYARESGREFTPEERRISAAEREATNATLDRMSEEMGIKINRVGRSQMPRGHKSDKGYYNPSTGEMTICMDNVTDERDAIATVLHETVGHHGLRKLFGDRFNDAMARIYAALDQKGRTWVNGYIARHPNADNTRAVEEYLSHLAESGNFKNTVWDNIRRIIGRIVDALFGTNGFLLTDNELNYILRASYENLKNPNWLNTVEGRAFDTLLKRQLGINETDPNKPTDPQGPDAGRLYRDGDTGIANDDYNREMEREVNKALTETQDGDRPVKIGMDKVMKEKGIKSISEDEDYLVRHNLASSRAESEAHEFELFRFTPLMDQVRAIQGRLLGRKATDADRQQAYERILDYMYAVSGLERNASKNAEIEQQKQDALEAAREEIKEHNRKVLADSKYTDEQKKAILDVNEKWLKDEEQKIYDQYEAMKRDWSGLTSLIGMDKDNWRAAETAAQAMISAFESAVGDKAALDELWNRVRACTDFSLEHAYQHGLLTREEFERLHGTASQPRMWDFYLPLRGFSETTTEELFNYETFTNPSRGNVVVKKMNGRWTQADNPLANILNIAETEIVQGNDNWAKQALYRFTLNAGDNTLLTASEPWFVKNPATGKWSMAFPDPGETLEEFEERMKALRALDDPLAKKGRRGLKLENIMANKAHRNEHAIHLKVGGIDKMIWVNGNPALAKAVSGIGRAQNLQWFRRASRALSNLFTTYSLDFTGKNLIRDTVYSNIALYVKEDKAYRHQYHKNWIANFGYGAFAYPMVRLAAEWESGKLQQKETAGTLTKRERDFLNFMRDGGQTGYTIINSVNQIKKDLEKQMRSAGGRPGTVPILGWYAKAVKTLNEGFELLTRFTAYQTSRDMGRSGQRAASDAKEISVNFNRRGAQSGEGVWGNIAAYLGATHYFFNAGVQGFDNFLGLFKKNPVKMSAITAGFVMMGVLTPLINSMLAGLIGGGDGDDDWYWNLPEWVRRNNLIIGTGKFYLAIPLPVEFRAPYGIGDIAGAAFAFDKYPNRHFGNVAGDILTTASGILPVNPIEGYTGNGNLGDAALRAVAPDAGMFFVDWATNRDYTGRPLWKENPFSDTVPKSQGAYASTPKGIVAACQKLAEVSNGTIDIAPGVVRDFMNNYGGGFFRAAEDVSKLLFTDEERPRRWDNVPFFSGFTGHIDEDRSNSFAQNALYDYKKLSEDNVKSMNAMLNTDEVTSAVLYDEPQSLYEREGVTLVQKAKIKRMLDSKDYALGKMYREGMNNKYKMKQSLKDGHWYKSRVERKGVNALRQEWKDLRDQWAKMPDKTEEQKSAKAEMDLQVQEAWHLYYDAMGDLAEKLMDYEYNK